MLKGAKAGPLTALSTNAQGRTVVPSSGGFFENLFGPPQKIVSRETPEEDYSFFRDMFDGGGMGHSANAFGGPLGGLLNALGIRPMGYTEPEKPTPAMLAAKRAGIRPSTTPPRARPPMPAAMPGVLPTAGYEPMGFNRPMQGPPMSPRLPSVPPVAGPYPLGKFGDLLMRLETEGIPQMPMYGRTGPR
jgi:hypothetical protein